MKKRVVFVGLMMVSTILFAQGGGPKHRGFAMGSGRIDRMKSELSLTDDQVTKMKAISEKYVQSFEQLRKDTLITVAASRAKGRKLFADEQSEIKGVLTPVQQAKWTELMAKRKRDRDSHKGGKHYKGNRK